MRRWRDLAGDTRGTSALEFALIAPMMLLAFFGVVETGQVVMASRRVAHAADTLSDLVARVSIVSSSDTSNCFAAGVQLLSPLATSSLKMKVTSVTQQSNGTATVDWSDAYNGMPPDTKGAAYAAPAGVLSNTGDSFIVSKVTYTLVQPTSYVLPNGLNYTRTSYSKPRNGSQVAHS